MTIKVRYSSVDGAGKSRTFKTLKGAQKFAQEWIGRHPDIGGGYAVSNDGVGKITCDGCTLADLFPSESKVDPRSLPSDEDDGEAYRWDVLKTWAKGEEVKARPMREDEIPF